MLAVVAPQVRHSAELPRRNHCRNNPSRRYNSHKRLSSSPRRPNSNLRLNHNNRSSHSYSRR